MNTLGQRIRNRREALGMTPSELAAAAGVSASMISNIECNRRCPSALVALALADALDISITLADLAGANVERSPQPEPA